MSVCVTPETTNCTVITKKLKNTFILYSNMILTIWRNVIDLLSGSINEKKWKFLKQDKWIKYNAKKVPRNNQNLYQRKKISWIIFVPIFFSLKFIYFENHSTNFQWIRPQKKLNKSNIMQFICNCPINSFISSERIQSTKGTKTHRILTVTVDNHDIWQQKHKKIWILICHLCLRLIYTWLRLWDLIRKRDLKQNVFLHTIIPLPRTCNIILF